MLWKIPPRHASARIRAARFPELLTKTTRFLLQCMSLQMCLAEIDRSGLSQMLMNSTHRQGMLAFAPLFGAELHASARKIRYLLAPPLQERSIEASGFHCAGWLCRGSARGGSCSATDNEDLSHRLSQYGDRRPPSPRDIPAVCAISGGSRVRTT